ncbi:PREDICTED: translation initiation factor IF-2-like [Capra hircus]|uniref:translation initiation factor IF-2-like n=1 Tax=Capra hircus TaxID=9925 RepID=UPI000847729B|nr:PREDICTED: translation initiation factor IF-2-like [Capra hircus]
MPRLRRVGTQGRPPPLESAFGAGGRSAAESPRPGAAQRLAAPPPPGPHPPAPIPPAVGAEPSGAGGRGSRALPPPPGAPCAPAASPGEGAAATCCGCPERAKDSRPGAARPRAGLLGSAPFRGSGSPPQPGRRPCAPPANCCGGRRKARSWLNLTIVLFPAGSLMSKMSFRVSLEIPWVCLQIRPVLGAVAFRINARGNLILSDSSRKEDPFQGPKLGFCLTLRNESSKETRVLMKQEILLGKGTWVESSRVREPRRTTLSCG